MSREQRSDTDNMLYGTNGKSFAIGLSGYGADFYPTPRGAYFLNAANIQIHLIPTEPEVTEEYGQDEKGQ